MTAKEVMELEKDNHSEIRLYHEGMFWRDYERSAFMMSSQVKKLKVVARRVRAAGNQVVSYVGFPLGSFDSVCNGIEVLSRSDDAIVLKSPKAITEDEFAAWKKQDEPSEDVDVVKMIKGFTVADHTPMECMAFIIKLQGLV